MTKQERDAKQMEELLAEFHANNARRKDLKRQVDECGKKRLDLSVRISELRLDVKEGEQDRWPAKKRAKRASTK